MGELKEFSLKYNRVLVDLDYLSFFIAEREGTKIAVVTKKPIRIGRYQIGATKWIEFKSKELIRGGVRLFREEKGIWRRKLPYGLVSYYEKNDEISTLGYVVLEKFSENEYKISNSRDFDAILLVFENDFYTRTCSASIDIEILKGEGYVDSATTYTAVQSLGVAIALVKPGTVIRVRKGQGEYRGECWTETETYVVRKDEKDKYGFKLEKYIDEEPII